MSHQRYICQVGVKGHANDTIIKWNATARVYLIKVKHANPKSDFIWLSDRKPAIEYSPPSCRPPKAWRKISVQCGCPDAFHERRRRDRSSTRSIIRGRKSAYNRHKGAVHLSAPPAFDLYSCSLPDVYMQTVIHRIILVLSTYLINHLIWTNHWYFARCIYFYEKKIYIS